MQFGCVCKIGGFDDHDNLIDVLPLHPAICHSPPPLRGHHLILWGNDWCDASLGGPKTYKHNILRVFAMSDWMYIYCDY